MILRAETKKMKGKPKGFPSKIKKEVEKMFVLTRKGIFKKFGKRVVRVEHQGGRWFAIFEDCTYTEISPNIARKIKARLKRY